MRPASAILVLVAATLTTGAAQPSRLDRPFDQPLTIRVPMTPADGRGVVLQVGAHARIPVGVEETEDTPAPPAPHVLTPAEAVARETAETIAFDTPREALDAIVAADPRYKWIETDGVVVVRPLKAWANPHDPLNRTVSNIDWQAISAGDALAGVVTLLYRDMPTSPPLPFSYFDERVLSIRRASGSVLDVLNDVVKAHGAVEWSVLYHRPDWRRRTGFAIELRNFDGHVEASYRPDAPQSH